MNLRAGTVFLIFFRDAPESRFREKAYSLSFLPQTWYNVVSMTVRDAGDGPRLKLASGDMEHEIS